MSELIARENADPDARRTKDRLLLLLKMHGGMTTKALASALEISVPAVRAHLKSLSEDVVARTEVAGVGRPAQVWHLTEAGQQRFPDTHGELTVRLLGSIERALGREALDAVIADRFQESRKAYQAALADLTSLSGRLRRLAEIRSDEGYMAQIQRTGRGWLLVENHCPICAAATACQGFCRNELELFRSVLGAQAHVERVEYLLEGGHRCAYEITRSRS
ncbi:MAG: helix-turn-helix transcriptional regulator [Pseudomonadales bacterium]